MIIRPGLLVTLFRVCISRPCGCFGGVGFVVAHASVREGGDLFSAFSDCLGMRVCPRDGTGSCVLANVDTSPGRHRVCHSQGSNNCSRQ